VQMRARYRQMWEKEDFGDVSNEMDVARYEELRIWISEVSLDADFP
jgi:hypothetical protein